ncbi:phage portal protein, partial [Nocardiopsis protaetiae]|uniref:phage portal protein n=1 Tax=Nocardiopsis protaetiae TaxID=3382270 RepID=UPI00387AFF76
MSPALIPLPVTPAITDDTTDVEAVALLTRRIANFAPRYLLLEAYYDGVHRLEALGLSLPPEMEALQTVVNWPAMYVDSLEERLDVEGFRLAGQPRTDSRLWGWWQDNDLDDESGMGHLDAMIYGRAFAVVGPADTEGAAPVITVESAES